MSTEVRLSTCKVCSVCTYPQSAPEEQKTGFRARGWKRQCGRGVCVNCYERYRKAGRLDELSFVRGVADRDDENAKACVRCGIKHKMPEDLCQDCVTVAGDLHELDHWAAAAGAR